MNIQKKNNFFFLGGSGGRGEGSGEGGGGQGGYERRIEGLVKIQKKKLGVGGSGWAEGGSGWM